MKPALSTTALSVRLAAIGTLLATAAWSPGAINADGQADRALSAKDNCIVHAVLPSTGSSVELPWFLRSSAPVKPNMAASARVQAEQSARTTASQMAQSLRFIENRGQVVDQDNHKRSDVAFYGSTRDAKLYFTRQGIGYVFYAEAFKPAHDAKGNAIEDRMPHSFQVMDMQLIGSNPNAEIVGGDVAPGIYNFCHGTKDQWITGVSSYQSLLYKDVYPNIDMKVVAQQEGLKYDFVVRPGGDPSQIRFHYNGAKKVSVTADGRLNVVSPVGTLTEQAPFSYQGQQEVSNSYRLNKGVVSFNIGSYDASRTMVIDPTAVWATFFGGSGTDVCE
jgi:hypothetical protein